MGPVVALKDVERQLAEMDGSPKTIEIVLVEDSPSDVRLFKEAIKRWRTPVRLTVADDGQKGIETLKAWTGRLPDLILININLPRVGGLDVLRWIRTRPKFNGIAAVVMSSSALDQDRANALIRGAASYFLKGHNFDEYCAHVDEMYRKYFGAV